MKKAWEDVRSFVTIITTLGYLVLTILGEMTPEYQTIYVMIIGCYFGTQFEKLKQLKEELKQTKENNDNGVG